MNLVTVECEDCGTWQDLDSTRGSPFRCLRCRSRNVEPMPGELSPGLGEEVWTTRTGERIPVRDMNDGHLKNALALVECKLRASIDALDALPPQPIDDVDRMLDAEIGRRLERLAAFRLMLQRETERREEWR